MSTSLPDIGASPKPTFPYETFRSFVQLLFPPRADPDTGTIRQIYPLSCPSLQVADKKIRGFLSSICLQALPGKAGGTTVMTTVDHTLMRGSEPHDR
jgi:hypothetical protein